MAERTNAVISIGGQVSRSQRLYMPLQDKTDDGSTVLMGLVGCLHDDRGSDEFGNPPIPPNSFEGILLNDYLDDNGLLTLRAEDICNGEFEETERFCMDYGIPFDRWSATCGEYPPENVYWRPGMKEPLIVIADERNVEVVSGDEVRRAMTALYKGESQDALLILESICPDLPNALPEFQITS